jgi:acyl-CoA thioesterase-1
MNRQKRVFPTCWLCLALVLGLALLFGGVACGQSTAPQAAQQPRQPVSVQQMQDGPLTYVALGASDAVGVGASDPARQGYVPLLESRLPQGSHLVDLGISGIRLHQALTQELPLALSANARLITIWLVVNDFVDGVPYDSYMQDLHTLLQQLRSGTHTRIVMANLPDLTLLPAFSNLSAKQKATMRANIQHWNAGIAKIAAQYAVAIVDLYAQRSQLTSHSQYISSDGFHPSAQGYTELAKLFWQVITEQ